MTARSDASRLRAARLAAHGLVGGGLPSITAAVERLGAVQAQDLGAAKWVLGARVPGSSEADVDDAIHSRRIIRTWPLRGTLHLMPADLVRPVLAVTGPREVQRFARRRRELELDESVAAAARRIAERDLAGGTRTREQLFAAWEAGGIATAGQRGYHLLWWLALDGVICGGPVEGRSQAFALLDEWSPASPASALSREETLTRLFVVYVRGHGPVTVRDFAWWSGLTLGDARAALAGAGDAVTSFDGDRVITADTASGRAVGRHALAGFDEYFLGYAERSGVCPPDHVLRVVPGGNGVFKPVLVRSGLVVGTWGSTVRAAGASVVLDAFADDVTGEEFRAPLRRWARFRSIRLREIALARA